MPTATGGHSEGERRGRGLDSEAISCAGAQVDYVPAPAFHRQGSGRSAAWLAHLTGGQGVGGSNPLAPTVCFVSFENPAGCRPAGFSVTTQSPTDRPEPPLHGALQVRACRVHVAVGHADRTVAREGADRFHADAHADQV
jgi:hypothetical protein